MSDIDIMKIKITKISGATLYIAKGTSYTWISHLDYFLGKNEEIEIETKKGWNFYVVGVGNS